MREAARPEFLLLLVGLEQDGDVVVPELAVVVPSATADGRVMVDEIHVLWLTNFAVCQAPECLVLGPVFEGVEEALVLRAVEACDGGY